MVRLVLRSLDSPWALELVPGLNKLGRNPTNDFRISDPSVSSFHAEISVEGEVIKIRDLGSTNGTYIDDQKVEEAVLNPGDTLRLGNVHLRLEEVTVTPMCHVNAVHAPATPLVDLALPCAYHSGVRSAYRCENCGGAFCSECVTIMGQSKFGATTLCPVCKGQCNPLPAKEPADSKGSLLNRWTQTLKIPFVR